MKKKKIFFYNDTPLHPCQDGNNSIFFFFINQTRINTLRIFGVFTVLLLFITFITFFYSCNKDNIISNVDFKYNYFPVQTGNWIEYEVDSITYDDFFDPIKIDTVSYFLKEEIGESFLDNENRESYKIEVYRREADTLSWQLVNIQSVVKIDKQLERVEDNLRFIKLIFPVTLNREWAGNAYFDYTDNNSCNFLGDWKYQYISIDKADTYNGLYFDSTLTVLQVDDENLLCKNYSQEIYAKNIGLVYKKLLRLATQNINTTIPFEEKAEKGFILTMKIKAYGS